MAPILDSLISILFPHRCRICGGGVGSLTLGPACSDCWSDTRIFSGSEALCPKCGNLLRGDIGGIHVEGAGRCHRCDAHAYDLAVACGVYEKALAVTIAELKVKPRLAPLIRNIMACRFDDSGLRDCDALIPIPLSRRRMLERGFNQAETIARVISDEFEIPIELKSLIRNRHTPIHRAGMDDKAREKTVRDAFSVEMSESVVGQDLVLVDDVMTSGATVAQCAKALKRAGAGRVRIFTLARTV